MKIKRLTNSNDRPKWLDDTFQLEMTGEELLRLFELSWEYEGGPAHDIGPGRFARMIEEQVPGVVWLEEKRHLVRGKYKDKRV